MVAGRQQAPQVAGEDVQFLELHVGEGQHLGEEGVQADVVDELAAEVVSLVGVELHEALARRFQRLV